MYFAHSLEGRDRNHWQPLQSHLQAVSSLTSLRAHKFGAGNLGGLVGLLHDLGKYTQEFQDYIAGAGQSWWSKGLFLPVAGMSSFERAAAERAAEDVVLNLLDDFNRQGLRALTRTLYKRYVRT
jgi:hypothetical protein